MPNGTITQDYARFPSGMAALGAYIRSKGLLFGIVSPPPPPHPSSPSSPLLPPPPPPLPTLGHILRRPTACHHRGSNVPPPSPRFFPLLLYSHSQTSSTCVGRPAALAPRLLDVASCDWGVSLIKVRSIIDAIGSWLQAGWAQSAGRRVPL
jgi:hypothetical protein